MLSKIAQTLAFTIYDTLTSIPFTGNPTPVFILNHLAAWLPESSMQLIARETNHSETVFVRHHPNANPSSFNIRFYTPTAEEPFCGHGVLGAAHALYAAGLGSQFDFTTYTGIELSASVATSSADKDHVTVSMFFPSSPILSSLVLSEDVRIRFAKALGVGEAEVVAIGMNELRDIVIQVALDIDFSAAKMRIDPVALLNASPAGTRSQVITSSWSLDPDVDFAKRVFAYGSEDQATGSTYCTLVPYWGEKLKKTEMRCLQPSWRGGAARLKWKDGGKVVEILAESVETVKGSIMMPSLSPMRAKL